MKKLMYIILISLLITISTVPVFADPDPNDIPDDEFTFSVYHVS